MLIAILICFQQPTLRDRALPQSPYDATKTGPVCQQGSIDAELYNELLSNKIEDIVNSTLQVNAFFFLLVFIKCEFLGPWPHWRVDKTGICSSAARVLTENRDVRKNRFPVFAGSFGHQFGICRRLLAFGGVHAKNSGRKYFRFRIQIP